MEKIIIFLNSERGFAYSILMVTFVCWWGGWVLRGIWEEHKATKVQNKKDIDELIS